MMCEVTSPPREYSKFGALHMGTPAYLGPFACLSTCQMYMVLSPYNSSLIQSHDMLGELRPDPERPRAQLAVHPLTRSRYNIRLAVTIRFSR